MVIIFIKQMNFVGYYGMMFKKEKIYRAASRLESNDLTIQDILEDDDLTSSFKLSSIGELEGILNRENISLLLDYAVNFPKKDTYNIGYKYPFNSTEILSSDCSKLFEILFDDEEADFDLSQSDECKNDSINIDQYYNKGKGEQDKEIMIVDGSKECTTKDSDELSNRNCNLNGYIDKLNKEEDLGEDENKYAEYLAIANEMDKQEEETPEQESCENGEENKVVSGAHDIKGATNIPKYENQEEDKKILDEKTREATKPVENIVEEEKAKTEMSNSSDSIKQPNEDNTRKDEAENTRESNPIQQRALLENRPSKIKTPPETPKVKPELKSSLLKKFFDCLNNRDSFNSVLAGYFAKIFSNLFQNKQLRFVKYIYERPEIITSMIYHFNKISVLQCISKLLKFQSEDLILPEDNTVDKVKEDILSKVFYYVEIEILEPEYEIDDDSVNAISDFFLECIETREIFLKFLRLPKFSLKLLETFLHPALTNSIHIIVNYLEKVYSELDHTPAEDTPENESERFKLTQQNNSFEETENNAEDCYYFLELFNSMIQYVTSRFKFNRDESKHLMSTFGERIQALGISRYFALT